MRKRFGLVEPQADWEVRAVLRMAAVLCVWQQCCAYGSSVVRMAAVLCVWQQCCAHGSSVPRLNVVQVQRLSKELGQELFGQHVKAFEVSTLT